MRARARVWLRLYVGIVGKRLPIGKSCELDCLPGYGAAAPDPQGFSCVADASDPDGKLVTQFPSCTQCDEHHFKAGVSDAPCSPCPAAPHEPGSTGMSGATSEDQCQCETGYGKRENGVCMPQECGAVQPAEHAENCAGGRYGDGTDPDSTCDAVCAAGFASSQGTITYMCGPDGTWIPRSGGERLVCTAAVCTADATGLPNDANIDDCVGIPTGQTCDVRCEDGYTGSGASTYTCSSTGREPGTWSGGSLVCTAVSCGEREVVGHASTCPVSHFRDTCEPHCDAGYESSAAATYTCGNDGQWATESSGMQCEAKVCTGSPGQDSDHLNSCGEGLYGGQGCTATCQKGYGALPGGSAEYTCGTDGQWTGGNLRCAALTCGAVPPSPLARPCAEGVYSDPLDSSTQAAQCEPHCDDGYELNQTSQVKNYTCGLVQGSDEPSWIGGAISCIARRCKSAAPCDNAKLCAPPPGADCTAECEEGYEPAGGTATFYCDSNGRWTSQSGKFSCTTAAKDSPWWVIPAEVLVGAIVIYFCGECVVGRIVTRVRHRRYGLTLLPSTQEHQDRLIDDDGLAPVENAHLRGALSAAPEQKGTSAEWAQRAQSSGEFTTRPPNSSTPSPGTGGRGWFRSNQKPSQQASAADGDGGMLFM